MNFDLSRFHTGHEISYEQALAEIKAGRKVSHWMWYIFPQLKGLGKSPMSEHYGITELAEASAYLSDPVLGAHMTELCKALLALNTDDAYAVFGSPDDKKLRSSMTLFALAAEDPQMFEAVLEKYFHGMRCKRTEKMIDRQIEEHLNQRDARRRENLRRFEQDLSQFTDPDQKS